MATRHFANDLQKTLEEEIRQTLVDEDGAGSDLGYCQPFGGHWIEVEGNLDVEHLASHVIHVLGLEYEYASRYTPDPEKPEIYFQSRWESYKRAMDNVELSGKDTVLVLRLKAGKEEVV